MIAIERLIRRKPVINAIGGLLGTGLAAFIALRTGKRRGLLRAADALIQVGYALVFAGSVVIRRPLTGFIIAALYRAEPGWGKLPRGPARDDRADARLGGAVRVPRARLRGPDRGRQASGWLAGARRS